MNLGESSCSGGDSKGAQENGAATSSEYRPHKKARFPWQIKGKHHLKNQKTEKAETHACANTPGKSESHAVPEPVLSPKIRVNSCILNETTIPFRSSMPRGQQIMLENELNKLDTFDCNLLQYTNTFNGRPITSTDMPLETVVAMAENMLKEVGFESDRNFCTKTKPELSRRESIRQAKRLLRQENKCILNWQFKQAMKGCLDNTINRVIEASIGTPEATTGERSPLEFAQLMNEGPHNDENVENEGILMAIHAHGLQNMGGVPFEGDLAIKPLPGLAIELFEDSSDSSNCSEDFQIYYEKTHGLWQGANASKLPTEPDVFNLESYNRNIADYGCSDILMDAAVTEAIRSKGLVKAGADFG